MLASALRHNGRINVFGGEPMLTPLGDLERIFMASFYVHGAAGVQTNGTLISEDHIQLFKRYNVGVGVSIDGPAEKNALRCDADTTARIEENIRRMLAAGVRVSLIVSVHKENASHGKIGDLAGWAKDWAAAGIPCINFHPVAGSGPWSLDENDEADAFLHLAEMYAADRARLRWEPFVSMRALLHGEQAEGLCFLNWCDPLHTRAVYGVTAAGEDRCCARLGEWMHAERHDPEMRRAVLSAPQEYLGCGGCRWFDFCTGGCPAEAIDGDWRNRSAHCRTYKALFNFFEAEALRQGTIVRGRRPAVGGHADAAHGDIPHGDSHGDHWDGSRQP